MASMPLVIDGRVRLTLQDETRRSSLRRHRLRETLSPCTYLRGKGLCLSLSGLVNVTAARFFGGRSTIRAQTRIDDHCWQIGFVATE